MTPYLPQKRFLCPRTDDRHAWLRVDQPQPMTKFSAVCVYCLVLVHTLTDGRGMIITPEWVAPAD